MLYLFCPKTLVWYILIVRYPQKYFQNGLAQNKICISINFRNIWTGPK